MKELHKAGAKREGIGKIHINLAQPDSHLLPKNTSPLNSLSPKTLTASTLQLETRCTPCCPHLRRDPLCSLLSAITHALSSCPVCEDPSIHALFLFSLFVPSHKRSPTLTEFMNYCTAQRSKPNATAHDIAGFAQVLVKRVKSSGKTLVCVPLSSLSGSVTVKLLSFFLLVG